MGISLFSGMGGDSLGMINAGIDLVAYSEWEKEMKELKLNFPESKLIGDKILQKLKMMNL